MFSASEWKPYMSKHGSSGSKTKTAEHGLTGPVAENPSSPQVCEYCQQPFDGERVEEWRGEPVHGECATGLRCGISVSGPDKR